VPEKIYCPHCGKANPPNAVYCRHCRGEIQAASSPMLSPDPPPLAGSPRERSNLAVPIVIIGLLLAVVAGYWFLIRPNQEIRVIQVTPVIPGIVQIPTGISSATADQSSTQGAEPSPMSLTVTSSDSRSPVVNTSQPTSVPLPTDETDEPDPSATVNTATSVPQPTYTPLPSYTPQPTNTPLPTLTPFLTATSIPTPTTRPPSVPVWKEFGETVRGEPLEVVEFGSGPHKVMILGGLHAGFAPASVTVADGLINYFSDNPAGIPESVSIYIIPSLNKDSSNDPGEWAGRANANGVDLNRNWDCDWVRDATWRGQKMNDSGGSRPFSEPETSALRNLILQVDPDLVIIWGALIRDGLIAPGQCEGASDTTRTSYALAGVFSSASGYSVNDWEITADQVVNGDASNWLDKVGIPSFFVILDDYVDTDWRNNLAGVQAILAYYAND